MKTPFDPEVYFSFFMFTADLRPNDERYTKKIIDHIRNLGQFGYKGFDLPIAPTNTLDHRAEVESYKRLREALDRAGLRDVQFTTNVAATRNFDPSSMDQGWREIGLAYLKSRVDITRALRADIMAGPIILPYNIFPTSDANEPIWSDSLQEWLEPRYEAAKAILEMLGDYAAGQGVKVAIEPVDHWETPAPNLLSDVVKFLEKVENPQLGVCIDSSHVVLGSEGPSVFEREVQRTSRRLHYVHISPPDRGALHDSWIPWKLFLGPIIDSYEGPFLIEVFNAVPAFVNSFRLTRRKFWIDGEEDPKPGCPSAYEIAQKGFEVLCQQISEVSHC